jgi:hypothetical protein
MLGLTDLAERIEFFRNRADVRFERFGRIGEGEGKGAKTLDLT